MPSSLPSKKNDECRGKKRRAETNDADSAHAAKNIFCSAKDFFLKQLTECSEGSYRLVEFWKKIPLEWQCDRDVAMSALTTSHGEVCKHLPAVLLEDREFLLRAVHKNSRTWESLPATVQEDVEFIRKISFYTSWETVDTIFRKVPAFANERVVWMAAFDSKNFSKITVDNLLREFAPISVLSDSEIMSKACSLSRRAFKLVPEPLKQNKEFIRGVLAANALVLLEISTGTQLLFPDLVVDAVPGALRKSLKIDPNVTLHIICLAQKISSELWKTNRDIVRAWFLSGGYFLKSISSHTGMQNLKDDRELLLLLAANFPRDHDPQFFIESFQEASTTLRSDKKFMLDAIKLNPNVFALACANLRRDFDLFLAAFGGTAGDYPYKTLHKTIKVLREKEFKVVLHDSITCFMPRVEKELKKYDDFVKTISYGIMSSGSPLSLLNQGEATAFDYKRRIAEYLDVPIGLQLKMLLNVKNNCCSILVKFFCLH